MGMIIDPYKFGFSIPTTSYANAGGTGNRTGSVTVTSNMTPQSPTSWSALVNGGFAANGTDSVDDPLATTINPGNYIQFDFGAAATKYIDEMKTYGISGNAVGTWKLQGSNDGSSFTDITAAIAWSTAGNPQTITIAPATQFYRYFRWTAVSGGTWPNSYIAEFEFKIN